MRDGVVWGTSRLRDGLCFGTTARETIAPSLLQQIGLRSSKELCTGKSARTAERLRVRASSGEGFAYGSAEPAIATMQMSRRWSTRLSSI